MNITQKLYNKMHLNAVLALIFFLKDFVYLGIVTSRKMLFSCISTSSLPCTKDSFLK